VGHEQGRSGQDLGSGGPGKSGQDLRSARPGTEGQDTSCGRQAGLDRAQGILRRCFPSADLDALGKFAEGWDNTIWEAGGFLFRIPKRKAADAQARKETALLRFLVRQGLPVPQPEYLHWGDEGFRHMVFGYRTLPGIPLSGLAVDQWPESIHRSLGALLSSLHTLDTVEAVRAGLLVYTTGRWRARYQRLLTQVQKKVLPVLGPAAPLLEGCFSDYFGNQRNFTFRPVVIHGDLAMEHVIVQGEPVTSVRDESVTGIQDESVTGIVDFADACVGDPALDFAGMSPGAAERVFRHYCCPTGPDPALLTRAQFYRTIAPCYALLYPTAAGPDEVARALGLLKGRR
jgi:aminoglycoside 2''-phosphotransferase